MQQTNMDSNLQLNNWHVTDDAFIAGQYVTMLTIES
jgi:hypothetical protein